MNRNILLVILLQFVTQFQVNESACATTLTCLHNGVFNLNTCKCDCMPAYSGKVNLLNSNFIKPNRNVLFFFSKAHIVRQLIVPTSPQYVACH